MALYNQICNNEECEMTIFQDRRKMSEIDEEICCPLCNKVAPRTMHLPAFHLKGGVWFKNGYGTTDAKGRPMAPAKSTTSYTSSSASKTHKK
jgi:hypothetical protein